MAQVKEQIKAPEKIQLSNEEIDNLSDAQFKTLVIRKLTEVEITWRVISQEGGRLGAKVEGIRNINVRYKIDRGRLRIIWEMEKPKSLYV